MVNHCRTLTLLELVLSLSILAVATIMLSIVFATSLKLSSQSDRIAAAHRDLQRTLETIMATPFNDIETRFPARVFPSTPDSSITVGGETGVDLDGDAALNAADDLIFGLPGEEMWISWQPIDNTGPIGNPGDTGNPLQLTVTVRWAEPDGTQLVRTASTVVAN